MDEIEVLREQVSMSRREQHSAEEREAALREVIQTIARSNFNLDLVLQAVTDQAVRLCQADYGNIARREGGAYRVTAFTGFAPEYERRVRERTYQPERGSVIGRTALERRVIHIVDVLADSEYSATDLQLAGEYRTLLGVPMLRQGEPIGVIGVARKEVRPFGDAEIRLIEAFSDHVVMAIENVSLYETVERQRRQLAQFAPTVADLLSSEDGERLLVGHRREITALFCDLRGFTAFAETAEPEEVFGILRQYHTLVGDRVVANDGTIEHFAGDGLMSFFNDPKLLEAHQSAALRTAVEIRTQFAELAGGWKKRGYDLGLGIGIATGYATIGRIGFEGRFEYGAIGNVVILASRLSDKAASGEILLSQRTHAAIEDEVVVGPMQELELKGFSRPIVAVPAETLRGGS
ncbi:MAG TPA: adenylate/guanylate cyclase domain-containing protein [Actinomycetota bacterium]|nr:adenylate/guanylate cyclase domain-containing protein [Actinomycetota bacterium]